MAVACLAVFGCAGTPAWTKAGSDAADTQRAYRDCLDMAGTAVMTEADIDEDIAATRGADLQRAMAVRVEAQDTRQHTTQRGEAIVAACMKAKGYNSAQ
jgi:hypothetical protein